MIKMTKDGTNPGLLAARFFGDFSQAEIFLGFKLKFREDRHRERTSECIPLCISMTRTILPMFRWRNRQCEVNRPVPQDCDQKRLECTDLRYNRKPKRIEQFVDNSTSIGTDGDDIETSEHLNQNVESVRSQSVDIVDER